MKKVLLAAFALVVLSTSAFAQNGRFSLGAEVALPMGDFGDAVNVGIGGTLRYEYPVGDNLGLMLTAGYLTFSGKTPDGAPDDYDAPSWNMIPIQAGLKYYFGGTQQEGFYGEVDLGVHATSFKMQVPTGFDLTTGTITYEEETFSSTDLSYAPAIGYHMDNLDFSLRYQMIATEGETTSYLGVRLAYVFGEK